MFESVGSAAYIVQLLIAFGAGVISFVSPCVLPLLPGYLSMMSGYSASQLEEGEVSSLRMFRVIGLLHHRFHRGFRGVGSRSDRFRTVLDPQCRHLHHHFRSDNHRVWCADGRHGSFQPRSLGSRHPRAKGPRQTVEIGQVGSTGDGCCLRIWVDSVYWTSSYGHLGNSCYPGIGGSGHFAPGGVFPWSWSSFLAGGLRSLQVLWEAEALSSNNQHRVGSLFGLVWSSDGHRKPQYHLGMVLKNLHCNPVPRRPSLSVR